MAGISTATCLGSFLHTCMLGSLLRVFLFASWPAFGDGCVRFFVDTISASEALFTEGVLAQFLGLSGPQHSFLLPGMVVLKEFTCLLRDWIRSRVIYDQSDV